MIFSKMIGNPLGTRELSRRTAIIARQIADYYDEHQLPEPTFDQNCPDLPSSPEYEKLRVSLSQTANDLLHLSNDPGSFIRTFTCSHYDLAAFQVALEFNFFDAVPLNRSIRLLELARTVGFDEDRVGSVIRPLSIQRIFEEIESDVFQHSAISAMIAKDEDIRAVCQFK